MNPIKSTNHVIAIDIIEWVPIGIIGIYFPRVGCEIREHQIHVVLFDGAIKVKISDAPRVIRQDLVDAGGKAIKEKVSKADADALKAKLEEAGATVEIK